MRKSILLFDVLISLCWLSTLSNAQTSDWLWAKREGGPGYDAATCMVSDSAGNIYVAGRYGSLSITLGTDTFINADTTGHSYDIFLVKYNSLGNLLWAKSFGGIKNDYAFSVKLDASENLYLAGSFESPTLIISTDTLTSNGIYDVFLMKLDNDGNLIWTKSAGGIDADEAYSVAVDKLGNIYLAGRFISPTIMFDSTFLVNTTLNSGNVFIVKYNAIGKLQWARSTGGENTTDAAANSLALDTVGNIYMAGRFSCSSIDFDTITLVNAGAYNFFLTKYDTSGNVIWAKGGGGYGMDQAISIGIDTYCNIYMTGFFTSQIFTLGSTVLKNTDTIFYPRNVFIAKYNVDGNPLWAKSIGGLGDPNEDIVATSIFVRPSGDAYITGPFYSSSIDFDTINLINAGMSDIFLFKYNKDGEEIWAKNVGDIGSDWATSVLADLNGDIYLAGWFGSPAISFNQTTLINANTTDDHQDMFIAKLSSTTGINDLNYSSSISIYPNPTSNYITINGLPKSELLISNINGQILLSIISTSKKTTINVSSFANGMYFIRIMNENGTITKKFIKQ